MTIVTLICFAFSLIQHVMEHATVNQSYISNVYPSPHHPKAIITLTKG